MSPGTVFMLALTALVLAGCFVFMSMLVGEGLYEKTETFIHSLSERGLFETEPAGEPEKTPAAALAYIGPEATETAAAAAPTDTPVPAARTIHIAAAGTIYAPKAVRQSAQVGEQFDFGPVFEGLDDTLREADLAIATLETTTAGREKGFGNYNTAPEILDALRDSGVDLLALATERALDKGYEGLELTIRELTARGLAYAGVNPDGYAGEATMISVDGIEIAVLSYSYGLSGDSEEKTKKDSRGALALINTADMVDDITRARLEGANLVIVLPHWGTKNKTETADTVRYLSRTLAEAGADVIMGTHPNVPQETERLSVTRSDGLTYEAVVCYSLGTLLTDSRTEENTAGMIAHIDVTYDPVTRRTTLGALYCTPVYVARQREGEETVYRVVDAEDPQGLSLLTPEEQERAQRAAERIQRLTDGQEGQG